MEKKRIRIAIVSVCIIAVLVGLIIFFMPNASTEFSKGDKVVIHIMAPSFEDMYGYEFRIHYNSEELEYSGELTSDIDEIYTTFSKPFDGYELVGATMIGDVSGVDSSKKTQVCQITFKALVDCVLTEESISIDSVGVVSSQLDYDENVTGWRWSASS